jgi:hypothetical protein
MRRLFTVILVGLATSALADSRWVRNSVVGLHIEIIDSTRIESYSCAKDGGVAVDIGTKRQITRQLTKETISTPEWYWRIHDGRLQLSDGSTIREEFTLLDMRNGFITARRRSGAIARFRYCFDCPRT